MKPFTLVSIAALCALAAGGAGASATNLVVNGSFEAQTQASGSWANYASLTGWTSGALGIELRDNVAGAAYDQHNFVELDTTGNSRISQVIGTSAGQQYTLEFAYSPREKVALGSNGIDVYWNNALVGSYDGAGAASGNNWSVKSLSLTAVSASSTLTFMASGASDALGGSLDAISLTSGVPEPESYAMLLLGLGLIGVAARRKQRR